MHFEAKSRNWKFWLAIAEMLIYYKPRSEDNENIVLPGVLINIFEVIEKCHGPKSAKVHWYIFCS